MNKKKYSLPPVGPQRVGRGAEVVPRDLGRDVVGDVHVDVVAEELDEGGVVAVDLQVERRGRFVGDEIGKKKRQRDKGEKR